MNHCNPFRLLTQFLLTEKNPQNRAGDPKLFSVQLLTQQIGLLGTEEVPVSQNSAASS